MQSLKFSINVYGLSSIELVPSYLILGEACIGLGRLSQAEDYLSQAQWTVLKTPECSSEIRSRLYRNLGMLYAGQGNSDEALKELAESIYQASCAYGTDDVKTSGGYFHMANIFYQEDKMDVAFSIFDHLTSIWHKHLSNLVQQRMKCLTSPKGIGPAQFVQGDDDFEFLDETQGAEAAQILHCIQNTREKQKATPPSILAKLYHTLGMLYIVLVDYKTAIHYSYKAVALMKPGATTADEISNDIAGLKEVIVKMKQEVCNK